MSDGDIESLTSQLERERRRVDFDNYDISVKELTSMTLEGTIDVAPEYQRQFRWKPVNRSRFIESVFLGIPIPNLFTAANKDATWELIDGVQRLSTLIHFIGDQEMRESIGESEPLKLQGLEILTEMNGLTFHDLPKTIALKFLLRPIKITNLSDKSEKKVRFDLFERLNTGGVILTKQEIRACVYRGEFYNFIKKMSLDKDFLNLVRLPDSRMKDGTPEELVLKFFSYFYKREKFDHSVVDFLNDFMEDSMAKFDYGYNRELFKQTFSQLSQELPEGIVRGNGKITPLTLFEAISVGGAIAVSEGHNLLDKNVAEWINSKECTTYTSGGGTNNRKKLLARIEYCAEMFRK